MSPKVRPPGRFADLPSVTFHRSERSSCFYLPPESEVEVQATRSEYLSNQKSATVPLVAESGTDVPPPRSCRGGIGKYMEEHPDEFSETSSRVISVERQRAIHMPEQRKMWGTAGVEEWIQPKCSLRITQQTTPGMDKELWAPVPSPAISCCDSLKSEAVADRTNEPDPGDDGGFLTPQYGGLNQPCNPERRNRNEHIRKLILFSNNKARHVKWQTEEDNEYKRGFYQESREELYALRRAYEAHRETTSELRAANRELQAANDQLVMERDAANAAYEQLNNMTWREFQQRQIAARPAGKGRKPAAKKAAAPKKAATTTSKAAPAKKAGGAAAAKTKSAGVAKKSGSRVTRQKK